MSIGSRDVSLGLGLVSLGRRWGFRPGEPPSPEQGRDLLRHAVARGIRFFDTAPAYGASEIILGDFLREIGDRRGELTIATKMGEHWIDAESGTRADHVSRRFVQVSIKACDGSDVSTSCRSTRPQRTISSPMA